MGNTGQRNPAPVTAQITTRDPLTIRYISRPAERSRVVLRAWRTRLAIVSGHDIDPATRLPTGWLARAATASPETALPDDMSNGTPHPVTFRPWDGTVEQPVDRAIQDTRTAVYPSHGLDPFGPASAPATDPRHAFY
jgi:hypothetical protein